MATIKSNLQTLTDSADRILLLQGPVGHFFRDFARWLEQRGKQVFKINFNAGDEAFYPATIPNTHAYRGNTEDFPAFLAKFTANNKIDAIACFGDTRHYHTVARQLAENTEGIRFWAFEEGYFRPFFITLEQGGVNDFSPLPKEAAFFQTAYPRLAEQQYRTPPIVPGGFLPVAAAATRYYVAANLYRNRYPHYTHHRPFDLWHYIKLWSLSGIKRANYWLKDSRFAKRVESGEFGRFFVVPLQVFNDSQVRVHSDFSSVRNFLLHVLTSFSFHAPQNTSLLIKHHPMDRGFIDYGKVIKHFLKKHPKLKGRIHYVHDVPLPVFLRHGTGMVTLNSTSGISALVHNMPVITLGRANYDIPGLTFQGSLAEFWQRPIPPDAELFHAYRQYHMNVTQINGSYYSRVNLQ
jgi:capsule polysaccharide modification protein lipB